MNGKLLWECDGCWRAYYNSMSENEYRIDAYCVQFYGTIVLYIHFISTGAAWTLYAPFWMVPYVMQLNCHPLFSQMSAHASIMRPVFILKSFQPYPVLYFWIRLEGQQFLIWVVSIKFKIRNVIGFVSNSICNPSIKNKSSFN